MPKKSLGTLTESMFYVLLSMHGMSSLCGTEIAARIGKIGGGAVEIGPATLYTVLGKFREAGYIEEIAEEPGFGRMRSYRLTDLGCAACEKEYARLRRCIADADAVWNHNLRYTDETVKNSDPALQTV